MTDQSTTYPLFTYPCGEMQWTATKSGKHAIIGYNVHSRVFFNHPSSGYKAIASAVTCDVQGRKKRNVHVLKSYNTIKLNLKPVKSCNSLKPIHVPKIKSYCTCNSHKLNVNRQLQDKLAEARDKMSPCPTVIDQAETDPRFIKQPNTNNPLCFVSTFYTSYNPNPTLGNKKYTISKQCCYRSK